MKTVETETQDERICRTAHNIAVLVKEQEVKMRESKLLCLAAIDLLLAHPDFFCEDFNQQLMEEKQTHLFRRLKDESSESIDQANEQLDEQQLREKYDNETIDYILRNMQLHLGTYTPTLQQDILLFLLSELPEKLREQQEQQEIEDVTSELLGAVGELPHDEQVSTYKGFLEQVKNGEVLAVA